VDCMSALRERTAQRRPDARVVLDQQDDSHRRDGTPKRPRRSNGSHSNGWHSNGCHSNGWHGADRPIPGGLGRSAP
jgi:hypothetical protein